jgi:oxygen-independent coproporphyrinogen-3 oxidase
MNSIIEEIESKYDRILQLYQNSKLDTNPLHYDFVSNYPSLSALKQFNGNTDFIVSKNKIGIYIHFPFCDYKCDYCYFISTITYDSVLIQKYVNALKKEILFYSEKLPDATVSYIYFGGGTPTAIDKKYLEDIVNYVFKMFKISEDIEFTCEGNPNTLNEDMVLFLSNLGINRISFGVQSFDNDVSSKMNRIQSREQLNEVINVLHKYFPLNFNVDFIFGHYSSNQNVLFNDLKAIEELKLPSVTFYQIWLNNITKAKQLSSNIKFEDLLYQRMCISIFLNKLNYINDKSDWYIKNNTAKFRFQNHKWENNDFIAIGVSSYGYINGTLYKNTLSIKNYLTIVDNTNSGISLSYYLNEREIEKRRICLGLKINTELTYEYEGIDFQPFIDMLVDNQLIIKTNNHIQLSYEGFLMSDLILRNI